MQLFCLSIVTEKTPIRRQRDEYLKDSTKPYYVFLTLRKEYDLKRLGLYNILIKIKT